MPAPPPSVWRGLHPSTGALFERLVRGSFTRQHSVQHLEGSTFVMFDNQSGKELSRLLAVDLATGLETTVFPNANTPTNLHLYSRVAGNVSVSPDRRRAVVSYSNAGGEASWKVEIERRQEVENAMTAGTALPAAGRAGMQVRPR